MEPLLKAAIVPVTPFVQNCSLLWCTRTMKAAIVDPGGEVDRIVDAIEESGVSPEKILVTHGHVDHVGGVADLAERYGLTVEGPQREDEFWIDGLAAQAEQFGIAGVRPFVPDRWLEGGDTVRFGDVVMDVLHCPGHTPGHVVFHHPPSRLAVVGDVLFSGSIGRTDFPRGDMDALLASIREQLWPLGDDITFISGHGPVSTFGEERRSNPFVRDSIV